MQNLVKKAEVNRAKKPIELRACGKKYGELGEDGSVLVIKKGDRTVIFDLVESTKRGHAVVVDVPKQSVYYKI